MHISSNLDIIMKTLLIPVDFSQASYQAVQYAGLMAADMSINHIVLLRSLHTSIYAMLLPSADFVQVSAQQIQDEQEQDQQKLLEMAEHLTGLAGGGLTVQTATSQEPLLRAVHMAIDEFDGDLVVVGTDNFTSDDSVKSYVAEQVIPLAKSSPIPVLVLPADVEYKPVQKALIPCDFQSPNTLAGLSQLHTLGFETNPELLILNVDPNFAHLGKEQLHLQRLNHDLEGYRYSIHYSEAKNIVSAVLDFADEYAVDLLIALPGKHSFLYNLTHRSITHALTRKTRLPILIL